MFLLVMKNYQSALLTFTKRARNVPDALPYIGTRWQTHGRMTGALDKALSTHVLNLFKGKENGKIIKRASISYT